MTPTLDPQHTPSASSGRGWNDVSLHNGLSGSTDALQLGPCKPKPDPHIPWNSLRRGDLQGLGTSGSAETLRVAAEDTRVNVTLCPSDPIKSPTSEFPGASLTTSRMAAKGQHMLDATDRHQLPQFYPGDTGPSLYPPTRGLASVSCQF